MFTPKSVYIAFEAFPRPKGASSHIASMVTAMGKSHGPVLLLCLGFGELPSFQMEGEIMIQRFKAYHPNMLKRSVEFGNFVYEAIGQWGKHLTLCVFRDPWGGVPALNTEYDFHTLFEVNALPSWELGYTYPGFKKNYPLKRKIEAMEHFCLSESDRILTVSPVTADALIQKEIPEDKMITIPNSAPDIFFRPCSRDLVPDFIKTGRWIGYFGSLHPWQGVEDAITAFSNIHAGFPDVNFLIITGGRKEERKRLKKKIRKLNLENRIILHHPMPHETLAPVIKRFEFTLAPLVDTPRNSRQGCCPVKIIESMASAVPVIATDLSCVRSLITHKKNGWLVPPGNTRSLSVAMKTLLKNQKLKKTLAENAFKKARADFNRNNVHSDLARCFDATINFKDHKINTRTMLK